MTAARKPSLLPSSMTGAACLVMSLAAPAPLSLERAFSPAACFDLARFLPEDPAVRFRAGALIGRGSFNEVYALERHVVLDEACAPDDGGERVLRINSVVPQLLEDAERGVREAYLMTALGRAGVSPWVESFGWTPDGRAWSVQERAEASLMQWLERVVTLSPASLQFAQALLTWQRVTVPSLLRALRRFASLDLYQEDVNPHNVVLRADGTAQLIDFDQAVSSGEGPAVDRCGRALARAMATLTSYVAGYASLLGPEPSDVLVAAFLNPFAEELVAAAALSEGRQRRQLLALLRQLPEEAAVEAAAAVPCVGWDSRPIDALLHRTRSGVLADVGAAPWNPLLWKQHLQESLKELHEEGRELV